MFFCNKPCGRTQSPFDVVTFDGVTKLFRCRETKPRRCFFSRSAAARLENDGWCCRLLAFCGGKKLPSSLQRFHGTQKRNTATL